MALEASWLSWGSVGSTLDRVGFSEAREGGHAKIFSDRPQRCFAGFGASFRFSFWRKGAGKEAEQNEKQNENETKNTVEVGPCFPPIFDSRRFSSPRLGAARRAGQDRARPKRCFSFCFRFVFRFVLPVFLRRSAQTKNKTKPEILQNSV